MTVDIQPIPGTAPSPEPRLIRPISESPVIKLAAARREQHRPKSKVEQRFQKEAKSKRPQLDAADDILLEGIDRMQKSLGLDILTREIEEQRLVVQGSNRTDRPLAQAELDRMVKEYQEKATTIESMALAATTDPDKPTIPITRMKITALGTYRAHLEEDRDVTPDGPLKKALQAQIDEINKVTDALDKLTRRDPEVRTGIRDAFRRRVVPTLTTADIQELSGNPKRARELLNRHTEGQIAEIYETETAENKKQEALGRVQEGDAGGVEETGVDKGAKVDDTVTEDKAPISARLANRIKRVAGLNKNQQSQLDKAELTKDQAAQVEEILDNRKKLSPDEKKKALLAILTAIGAIVGVAAVTGASGGGGTH